jgi:hypothetical protein
MSIYFNRSTKVEENICDKITIGWDEDTYVVHYRGDSKDTDRANTGVLNSFETKDSQALLAYISNCLTLAMKDQCPFATIDVLIPCFPSVKFFPSNLGDVKELIVDCVRMWM